MAQYFPAVFPVLLWSTSTALTMFLRLRANSNKIAYMANDLVWDENTCSVFSPLLSFPDTAWHIIGIKSKLLPCPIVYLMYCKHCCSCADVCVCVSCKWWIFDKTHCHRKSWTHHWPAKRNRRYHIISQELLTLTTCLCWLVLTCDCWSRRPIYLASLLFMQELMDAEDDNLTISWVSGWVCVCAWTCGPDV